MTVASELASVDYAGDGATSTFPVPFRFLAASHLSVQLRAANGTLSAPAFTASGAGAQQGGLVTLTSVIPAVGETLLIARDVPVTQETDYVANDPFGAETHEAALDKLTMIAQQLRNAVARALQSPAGDLPLTLGALPVQAARAARLLGFDAAGQPVAGPATALVDGAVSAWLSGLSVGEISSVSTRAALTALLKATLTDGDVIRVLGYTAPGDGGGGLFRWDASATTPSSWLVLPSDEAGSGRWVQLRDRSAVPLTAFGISGVGDETAAFQSALDSGEDLVIPRGLTVSVTGGLSLTTAGQRLIGQGAGTIKKTGTDIQPIIAVADRLSGVRFEGVRFDGARSLFMAGNAVPAIMGYVLDDLAVIGCTFADVIDSCIKLRDSARLTAVGNRFFNVSENGIELRHYAADPRTGSDYPARPYMQGGHRIIGNLFERIWRDETAFGIGDGCAVTFDCVSGSRPIRGMTIANNTVVDCLRGFFSENYGAGNQAEAIAISGNVFLGNVAGPATAKSQIGVGLISVRGAVVSGNSFYNIGNFTQLGKDSQSIIVSRTDVSANSFDVVINGNTCIDDTGGADRTDYHIRLAAGDGISAENNVVRGAAVKNILVESAATNVSCSANTGGEGSFSWSAPKTVNFYVANISASTANGVIDIASAPGITEYIMTGPGKIVGMAIAISAPVAAGSLSFQVHVAGSPVSGLVIDEADLAGGERFSLVLSAADGVLAQSGQVVRVYYTTDANFSHTTTDAFVSVSIDQGCVN